MVDPTAFARVAAPQRSGLGSGLASIIAGEQAGRMERQEARDEQVRKMGQNAFQSWQQGDQQGFQNNIRQLATVDAKAADDINSMFGGIQRQNLGEAAFQIYAASRSPDMAAKKKLIGQAKDTLQADPNNIFAQGLDRMLSMTDEAKLDEELLGSVSMAQNIGLFPKGSALGGGQQVEAQKTGAWLVSDEKGNVMPMVGVFDPTTRSLKTQTGQPLPEGWKVVGKEGESPQERRQRELEQKQSELAIGSKQKQYDELTQRGLLAAESIPGINRSIELLDTVKTGGLNAMKQYVKAKMGIEESDAGELAFLMSKNVLGQLKATFGAAFTKEEADRLFRIEQGFGKNTDVNRRLMGQALSIAKRTATRARKAAMDRGDDAMVRDIDELMAFKLSPGTETAKPAEQQTQGMQRFTTDQTQGMPRFRTLEEGEASGAKTFVAPGPDGRMMVYQAD